MGQRPMLVKLVLCCGVGRIDGVRCHDSPFRLVSICSLEPLKTNDGNACPEGLGQGFGVERGDVPGGISPASITARSEATEDMAQQVPTGAAPCRSLAYRGRSNPAAREGIGNGCGSKAQTESRNGRHRTTRGQYVRYHGAESSAADVCSRWAMALTRRRDGFSAIISPGIN
jgi:hypothetical protein